MSTINERSRVTLHFSLAMMDGLVIDSTFDKPAPAFTMGDGSLLPGFERCLLGLSAGDEKSFVLAPADAFGEVNADSIHHMPIQQFSKLLQEQDALSEGLVVSFDGAGKQPMPGVIRKIEGNTVTVDFNHPLAGQTLRFSVRILAVNEPIAVKRA